MNPLTRRNRDEAVSPVIAVILMVAITVILGVTVWIWVQGFSTGPAQAGSLGLNQNGSAAFTNATAAAACGASGATWCAKWTVTTVSLGFPADRLRVTDTTTSVGALTCTVNGQPLTNTSLAAGDSLACYTTTLPRAASGDRIAFVDTRAESVIAQLSLV